jgi:hypothetical protein
LRRSSFDRRAWVQQPLAVHAIVTTVAHVVFVLLGLNDFGKIHHVGCCAAVPCDAQIGQDSICRFASRASCKLVFFPSASRLSALLCARFLVRTYAMAIFRAWSSLKLGRKLSPSCARRVGRRGRLAARRRPCARLSSTSSPSVPDPLLLRLSHLSSRARPSSYHPHPLHFTSSRRLIHSHITLAVFTSSHHFTTIYVTSLR